MEASKSSTVNIVVWADNEDKAKELVSALAGGEVANEEWTGVEGAASVKGYIRYPGCYVQAHPKNSTDVLILSFSGSDLETGKAYMDTRKGIPFKYVTSSEDLSEFATGLNAEFVSASEILSIKSKIVQKVLELDETLRKAFEGLDLNKNGFITADELVNASATLGYELNSEEAKQIVSTLSPEGNINFAQFKSWWVVGKGDLHTFRNLVAVEMTVGGFLKKGSDAFNKYLASTSGNDEDSIKSRVNIGPTQDFESGIGVTVDLAGGKNTEELLKDSPDYVKSNPMTYGLEIRVRDEAAGSALKETLEGLVAMGENIPQVSMVLNAGLQIHFRNVGTSVFIDFSLGGAIGDQAMGELSKYNLEKLNFSGTSNMTAFSGLKVTDILTGSIEDLIMKVCQFRVQSHSEYSGIKKLIHALIEAYKSAAAYVPRSIKTALEVAKLFGAIRSIGYEFQYDVKELVSVAKEILSFVGETMSIPEGQAVDVFGSQLASVQGMGTGMIDMYKPMAEGMLEPFKPTLEAINFDQIGIYTVMPSLKVHYKSVVHLPGLTAFIGEKILN